MLQDLPLIDAEVDPPDPHSSSPPLANDPHSSSSPFFSGRSSLPAQLLQQPPPGVSSSSTSPSYRGGNVGMGGAATGPLPSFEKRRPSLSSNPPSLPSVDETIGTSVPSSDEDSMGLKTEGSRKSPEAHRGGGGARARGGLQQLHVKPAIRRPSSEDALTSLDHPLAPISLSTSPPLAKKPVESPKGTAVPVAPLAPTVSTARRASGGSIFARTTLVTVAPCSPHPLEEKDENGNPIMHNVEVIGDPGLKQSPTRAGLIQDGISSSPSLSSLHQSGQARHSTVSSLPPQKSKQPAPLQLPASDSTEPVGGSSTRDRLSSLSRDTPANNPNKRLEPLGVGPNTPSSSAASMMAKGSSSPSSDAATTSTLPKPEVESSGSSARPAHTGGSQRRSRSVQPLTLTPALPTNTNVPSDSDQTDSARSSSVSPDHPSSNKPRKRGRPKKLNAIPGRSIERVRNAPNDAPILTSAPSAPGPPTTTITSGGAATESNGSGHPNFPNSLSSDSLLPRFSGSGMSRGVGPESQTPVSNPFARQNFQPSTLVNKDFGLGGGGGGGAGPKRQLHVQPLPSNTNPPSSVIAGGGAPPSLGLPTSSSAIGPSLVLAPEGSSSVGSAAGTGAGSSSQRSMMMNMWPPPSSQQPSLQQPILPDTTNRKKAGQLASSFPFHANPSGGVNTSSPPAFPSTATSGGSASPPSSDHVAPVSASATVSSPPAGNESGSGAARANPQLKVMAREMGPQTTLGTPPLSPSGHPTPNFGPSRGKPTSEKFSEDPDLARGKRTLLNPIESSSKTGGSGAPQMAGGALTPPSALHNNMTRFLTPVSQQQQAQSQQQFPLSHTAIAAFSRTASGQQLLLAQAQAPSMQQSQPSSLRPMRTHSQETLSDLDITDGMPMPAPTPLQRRLSSELTSPPFCG